MMAYKLYRNDSLRDGRGTTGRKTKNDYLNDSTNDNFFFPAAHTANPVSVSVYFIFDLCTLFILVPSNQRWPTLEDPFRNSILVPANTQANPH